MYTVRWRRSALDRLTEIWMSAADRAAINSAVEEIDQLLALRPNETGESRSEDVRVYFCPPPGVFFEVDDASDTVRVLRVWTF